MNLKSEMPTKHFDKYMTNARYKLYVFIAKKPALP